MRDLRRPVPDWEKYQRLFITVTNMCQGPLFSETPHFVFSDVSHKAPWRAPWQGQPPPRRWRHGQGVGCFRGQLSKLVISSVFFGVLFYKGAVLGAPV